MYIIYIYIYIYFLGSYSIEGPMKDNAFCPKVESAKRNILLIMGISQ